MNTGVGLRLAVVVVFSIVELVWASATCLPNAVPHHLRSNISANGLPIGLYTQDWESAKLLTDVTLLLISEIVSYHVVITGSGPSSLASVTDFVGCVRDENGLECPGGPYPKNHPHHALFDVWEPNSMVVANELALKNPERTFQNIDVGYSGEDGFYVPTTLVQVAHQERGIHLEYYSGMDARWNVVSDYFDSYPVIDVNRLKPCNATSMLEPAVIESLKKWTPDPGSFDSNGKPFCPDGYWWRSPECRKNTSVCVPYLTGGDGWGVVDVMQKAIAFHLPLAVATAADWGNYKTIPHEFEVLVYSWEPSMHFIDKNLTHIIFPPADVVAQHLLDFRTARTSLAINNLINSELELLAPRVAAVIRNIRLSSSDMRSLLRLMATLGDSRSAACRWLSKGTLWQSWIPDEKECGRGQGLISQERKFVENFSLATSCAPCTSGRLAQKLSGTPTRICALCRPGEVQPLWGMDTCSVCSAGYYQDRAGQSSCERCAKGTYSNNTGGTRCADCPAGKTTDGTGLTSASDCGCPPSTYFDISSQSCIRCGEGMACDGFGARPRAVAGYQLSECGHDLCVFKCHHEASRCPGGELRQCAIGRTGVACAECEAGKRPASHGTCIDCSSADAYFVVFTLIVICSLNVGLYYKNVRATTSSSSTTLIIFGSICTHVLVVLQTLSAISNMSIGWVESAHNVFALFSVLAFDIEWVRLPCTTDLSVANRYFLRCMIAPCCIGVLALTHTVSVASGHCRVCGQKHQHRLNVPAEAKRFLHLQTSIFDFVMFFLFSIAATFLSPFRCQLNPNTLWTMTEYESQICWQSSEHTRLLIVGSSLIVLPLSFFAYIIWVLRRLESRLAAGDVDFLRGHDFLFARIRPERLWFAFVVVFRNLGIAILLVFPNVVWQAFNVEFIIVLYSLVVLKVEPWRFPFLNLLDSFFGLLSLVIFACIFIRLSADKSVETLVVAMVVSWGFAVSVVCAWSFYKLLFFRQRTFRYYLCYNKQSAGALARLLYTYLCRITPQGSKRIFLSADHQSELNIQLWQIRSNTQTFLVVLTSWLFRDPWCLGEIATANRHRVPTRLLYLPSFALPEIAMCESIIAWDYGSILSRHGIPISVVKQAVSHILTILATGREDPVCVKGLEKSLEKREHQHLATVVPRATPCQVVPEMSVGMTYSRHSLDQYNGCLGLLLHDSMVEESLVSAILLQHFLRTFLRGEGMHLRLMLLDLTGGMPDRIMSAEQITLVACLTHGCFHSNEFILGLTFCSVLPSVVATVPVVIPEDFQHPTGDGYQIFLEHTASFCAHAVLPDSLLPDVLKFVGDFTKQMRNIVASFFLVKSNLTTLKMQTKAIWSRIEPALSRNRETRAVDVSRQQILDWACSTACKTWRYTFVEGTSVNLDSLDDCVERPDIEEDIDSNRLS